MAEEILVSVNVSGEDNLSNLDTNLNKVTESSKKTVNAFTAMRKEVRDAKATMLSAAEGSDEYNDAMQRAAAAADKMRDMNDKIKASQKDVGVVAKNVAGAISGLAGAFSTAEGVIGLFGVESENTTKAILKIQQIMAVTSGIAQFADAMDNMKDLYGAVKLRVLAMVAAKQAETVATVENTAANVGEAAAITSTGVAAQVSGKAILAALGPYALVAAAIGLIVVQVMKMIENINKIPDEIKIDIEIDEEVGKKLISNMEKARQFALDYNAAVKSGNSERIKGLADVGVKEFGLHKDQLKMIGDNVDNWRIAFNDYLTMARLTYKEEAYIKKSAEAEINKETLYNERKAAKLRAEQAEKELINTGTRGKGVAKLIKNGGLLGFAYSDDSNQAARYAQSLKQFNDLDEQFQSAVDSSLKAEANLRRFTSENNKELEKMHSKSKTFIKDTKPGKELTKKEPTLQKGIVKTTFVPTEFQPATDIPAYIEANKEFDKLNQDRLDSENYKDRELKLVEDKRNKSIGKQLKIEKNYLQNISDNAKENLAQAQNNVTLYQKIYDDEVKALNGKIFSYDTAYNTELSLQNDYKNKIAKNNQELSNIDIQFKDAKTKRDQDALQARYTAILKENKDDDDQLKLSENRLKNLEGKKTEIDTGTKAVEEIGNKVKEASQGVIDANQAIVNSNADLANNSKDTWANMVKNVTDYADTAKGAFDAMANLNQSEIDSNNAKYDANEEMIQNSNMSEDEKTAALKKNEQERYKENLKAFEAQKKWQIASVLASSASSIAKTWEGYSSMGIPGAIMAGIQTAVIAANTIAQIKTIKAQRMDAPSEGSSSSSSTSTTPTANVYQALQPTNNSLTSNQENLNAMSAASQKNVETIVKVSDINKTQNKVTVRENNSSY